MKFKTVICFVTITVLLSSCLLEVEGTGKLGLLKLVKAGIILKALTHKKIIPLPLPIPIPIGIHKEHHHDVGHHGYGGYDHGFGGSHHGFGGSHHGYGGGFGGGHHGFDDYHHEPHYGHGHKVYSTGWRLEGIGKWW
ncbi:uncharacterized protein LOC129975249 [Argiope bruennichi]|uniref:Uncharacterized protein n=1 Tax=Argiope bruennichi TaxID=94029 RepID=A0A8T0ETM2_ARGBR|nr:uncharacterized protein LOC129975249 [Argiope bruennichi]KAF8777756.1 hypothetical protein HNY73_014570 [Argiope bruennichi]